jgi:hypothetical protein
MSRIEAIRAGITTLRLEMECKCEKINNYLAKIHREASHLSCCVLCCDCHKDRFFEEYGEEE